MIKYHHHQGHYLPSRTRYSRPKRTSSFRHDRVFHLPTTIAQNDPFLRRLYGAVSFYLDDHPYPATPDEFARRNQEIKHNLRYLDLPPDQQNFLKRLMKETGVTLVDLWQGSHIISMDRGYLYNMWSQSPYALPRPSSHYQHVPLPQYGINFGYHQLLFGKTSLDGSTWFQMEAHAYDPNGLAQDPDLVVNHGQDFLKYRIHNMNVGPFGFSPHIETNDPIIRPYHFIQAMRGRQRQKYVRSDRLRFSF